MRLFFAYIRVSTAKQGERGVSLQEQRDAITAYAKRNQLEIAEWFEEKETAAKRGRTVFTKMLKLLQRRKVEGVVIHKIDRSARNLRDWAELGELIDRGITVHFANENLDLYTRGGRLSADIQAVVAADYIRNLREEVKKGFYGRLKQGLYPLPAPVGYLDRGGGKVKEIDSTKAPLVKRLFETYATGCSTLDLLVHEADKIGLRSKSGRKLTSSSISDILTNPFYMGLIRIKSSSELFQGIHEPLVTKSLFEAVQAILKGKGVSKVLKHDYLFRRLLTCAICKYSLTGERQKGRVYYRCHIKSCPTTGIREDYVESAFNLKLIELKFTPREEGFFESALGNVRRNWETEKQAVLQNINLNLGKNQDQMIRLTDVFLDGAIDRETFDLRRNALILEKKEIEENLSNINENELTIVDNIAQRFELAKNSYYQYNLASTEQKRNLVKILTSNRLVSGKTIEFTWLLPYQILANRSKNSNGGPSTVSLRTVNEIINKLIAAISVRE